MRWPYNIGNFLRTLATKGNDPLSRAREVGDDKADARIKLALMPLDLGNHPARLRPASGLIAEISLEPPGLHLVVVRPDA